MNNDLVTQKSWWKRHWKWFLPFFGLLVGLLFLFFSLGLGGAVSNMSRAYADTELYNKALEKVKSDKKAIELLGEIEPIDKLAILEGSVGYSEDKQTVNSSIRVKGSKLIARMDISAVRVNSVWKYEKINIRVKNPPEKKQTIEIIKAE